MKTLALIAATLALGGAAPAMAQKATGADRKTPDSWSYDIKDGKRVPKAKRQVNADGSWREEIRRESCVTIREKSTDGVYRERREC